MMENGKKVKILKVSIIVTLIMLVLSCISLITVAVNKRNEELRQIEIEKNKEHIFGIIDNTNTDTIYLTVNETYQLDYQIDSDKYPSEKTLNYFSNNTNAVTVNENGLVKAIGNGETTITISVDEYLKTINIISTDLLLPLNNDSIFDKPFLECGQYTKEENDLIDKILMYRVNNAGYSSRAGVVAAARFLLIEFPYKIDYFYENGRISNNVDGEGRYYHKGLYLNESRYEELINSIEGPVSWGCKLYSIQVEEEGVNGLDCSGFVSWALLNGGFDPGDVGAGKKDGDKDSFYYIGQREKNSLELISSIKAGDLVHNDKAGGHIGMVIGIDNENIYVAQAIWYKPNGVVVTKYTYDEFIKDWTRVILMDDYYLDNGNYTNMWN